MYISPTSLNMFCRLAFFTMTMFPHWWRWGYNFLIWLLAASLQSGAVLPDLATFCSIYPSFYLFRYIKAAIFSWRAIASHIYIYLAKPDININCWLAIPRQKKILKVAQSGNTGLESTLLLREPWGEVESEKFSVNPYSTNDA